MALQGALTHIITTLRHESQDTQNNKIQSDLLNCLLQPNFTTIVKMYDEITTSHSPEENFKCIKETVDEVNEEFSEPSNATASELLSILSQPHMKSIIQASHDIANRRFEPEIPPDKSSVEANLQDLRTVEVEFEKPLTQMGFTLAMEEGQVKVARIIQHGYVATLGLLSEGDVILAVNNEVVNGHSRVEDVQRLIRQTVGTIKLKIIPSNRPNRLPLEDYFVQANFNYQADNDKSLPAQSVGLSFKKGTILQILSQEDQYWWQAKLVSKSQPSDFCGLIPSLVFEERRRAKTYKKRHKSYEDPTCKCYPVKVKSLKHSYSSVFTDISNTLDQYEMHLYEEVAQVPSFERNSIIVIATPYSLKKYIVNKLKESDPANFIKPVEYTNNTQALNEADTQSLSYVPIDQLLAEIQNKNFLTVAKHENTYSCVKEDSIKEIIDSGRVCVIDAEAHELKLVKRVTFSPLIVLARTQHVQILQESNNAITPKHKTQSLQTHMKESDTIMSQYGHLIDVVVNITPSIMVESILEARKNFSEGPQWVPASWVY